MTRAARACSEKRSIEVWFPHPEMMLLHARYEGQAFPRHTHDTYVVGINEASAHTFYCRRDVHTAPPGTIALIEPEEVHTGESARSWHYRGFYPQVGFMRTLWQEMEGRDCEIPVFRRSLVIDEQTASALLALHGRVEQSADTLEVESLAVDTFTQLLRRHAVGAPAAAAVRARGEDDAVRRMLAFMHAHAAEHITLSQLAAIARLTRFRALRAFRQEMGIPPYELLTSLRVEHARRLLCEGCSIPEAAYAAGFADQSHLTRRFKRHYGITPGAWQAALQHRSRQPVSAASS